VGTYVNVLDLSAISNHTSSQAELAEKLSWRLCTHIELLYCKIGYKQFCLTFPLVKQYDKCYETRFIIQNIVQVTGTTMIIPSKN
jgi:hypothetical protein